MQFETLLYSVTDQVATVTLNRPEAMNALSRAMRLELAQAMKLAAEQARVVVLTGAANPDGKQAFCAGQDLGDIRAQDLELILREEYAPALTAIAEAPVPTVALVNGVAAGAGAHIAMCADIVLAAESASFVEPFARIGLVPAGAGSYWLPRLVGPARAMGMCLLSEPVSARQAVDWGLIWEAVPDHQLQARADVITRRLAKGPTTAFARTKQLLRASLGNSWEEQLSLEAVLQGEAGQSYDYKEGVAAFLDKRKPEFEGR
ncbi:MAG: enoyl-CoA hydratase-related protein [Neomegalonema sp.]|nr:enoyl-CoA hydratase-related protein [Neomegalonema sp.]